MSTSLSRLSRASQSRSSRLRQVIPEDDIDEDAYDRMANQPFEMVDSARDAAIGKAANVRKAGTSMFSSLKATGESVAKSAKGVISGVASSASKVFTNVVSRPLKNMMGMVSDFMDFDYPLSTQAVQPVSQRFAPTFAYGEGLDNAIRVAGTPSSTPVVAPNLCSVPGDEMNIALIASTPSLLTTFDVDLTNSAGDALFTTPVNPKYCRATPGTGSPTYSLALFYPTVLAAVAAPFSHWRGTLRYYFKVIAPMFTSMRLIARFAPGVTGYAPNSDNLFTRVVDVQGPTEFTMEIPFIHPRFYARHSIGSLSIYLGNDLSASSTLTSMPVTTLVYVAASPDFCVFGQQLNYFIPEERVRYTAPELPATEPTLPDPGPLRSASRMRLRRPVLSGPPAVGKDAAHSGDVRAIFTKPFDPLVAGATSNPLPDVVHSTAVTSIVDVLRRPEQWVFGSPFMNTDVAEELLLTPNGVTNYNADGTSDYYFNTTSESNAHLPATSYTDTPIRFAGVSDYFRPTAMDHFACLFKYTRGGYRLRFFLNNKTGTRTTQLLYSVSKAPLNPAAIPSLTYGSGVPSPPAPLRAVTRLDYSDPLIQWTVLPQAVESSNSPGLLEIDMPYDSSSLYHTLGVPPTVVGMNQVWAENSTTALLSSWSGAFGMDAVDSIARSASDDLRFHFIRGVRPSRNFVGAGWAGLQNLDPETFCTYD